MSELMLWMDKEILKMKRDMDRLFKETWPEIGVGLLRQKVSQQIAVETYLSEDVFTIRALLPGMDPKSLDISVDDYQLTISGGKKEESEDNNGYCRHMERKLRSFSRTIPLPFKPSPENIKAILKKDELTIRMVKEEPKKKRVIQIESA